MVDKLRATDEKWHIFGHTPYNGTQYQSIGIALRLAGVGVLTDFEAKLKWDKLCACLDIEYDQTNYETEFYKLYGWNVVVITGDEKKGWVERGLTYLDCRLQLTFSDIAAIIEGALDGFSSIDL